MSDLVELFAQLHPGLYIGPQADPETPRAIGRQSRVST